MLLRLFRPSGRFAGVACLGAVIRGETDHYDYVCAEVARGVMRVQLDTGVPCTFGVLTCATMEQALARAGGAPPGGTSKRDQGRHAAEAAIRLAALREELAYAGGTVRGVGFDIPDIDIAFAIDAATGKVTGGFDRC